MPHRYTISSEERLVIVIAEGISPLMEGADVLRKLAEDPEFGRDFAILVDVRKAQATLSASQVDSFVKAVSATVRLRKHRIAIVTDNLVFYGFGRMISIVGGLAGLHFKTFAEVEPAREWALQTEPSAVNS